MPRQDPSERQPLLQPQYPPGGDYGGWPRNSLLAPPASAGPWSPNTNSTFNAMTLPHAHLLAAKVSLSYHRLRAYRMLALMSIFDAIFNFLLFALVCEGFHGAFKDSYLTNSVTHFKFDTSLFDVVCVAVGRALILLFFYWYLRVAKPYCLIFTTTGSTVFLLAKVFYYQFTSSHPTDYLVFIAAFLMPWMEAWFFSSRLAPISRELALIDARTNDQSDVAYGAHTNAALYKPSSEADLSNSRSRASSFHSAHSFSSMDDERPPSRPRSINASPHPDRLHTDQDELRAPATVHYSGHRAAYQEAAALGDDYNTRSQAGRPAAAAAARPAAASTNMPPPPPPEVASTFSLLAPYTKAASDAVRLVYELATSTGGWEMHTEKAGVTVLSLDSNANRIYRSEGYVYASPAVLFHLVHGDPAAQVKWNSLMQQIDIVEPLDLYTDICYSVWNISGMVSTRDFVDVRQWHKRDGNVILANVGIEHPNCPPSPDYVRGLNGPSGFVFLSVDGQPHVTKFVWIINMDLKGWVPSMLIDKITAQMMIGFHENLRRTIEAGGGSAPSSSHHGHLHA